MSFLQRRLVCMGAALWQGGASVAVRLLHVSSSKAPNSDAVISIPLMPCRSPDYRQHEIAMGLPCQGRLCCLCISRFIMVSTSHVNVMTVLPCYVTCL